MELVEVAILMVIEQFENVQTQLVSNEQQQCGRDGKRSPSRLPFTVNLDLGS